MRSSIPESRRPGGAKIRHVVIIFQENRTVDNLFNGLPGADTVRDALNSHGERVALRPVRLTAHYDVSHEHSAYIVERANGKLNGFNRVESTCQIGQTCPPKFLRPYGYVPHDEVRPYFTMAQRYTFADRMFQSNEGPSFPAHQYILSGTSTTGDGAPLRAASNPFSPFGGFSGGCDSPGGSWVRLIDPMGNENQATYPCFDRLALSDLLERKSHTWRYYQAHLGAGLWEGPDAIAHIRNSKSFAAHVVAPSKQVLDDIDAGSSSRRGLGDADGRRVGSCREHRRHGAVVGCLGRQRDRIEQVLERHGDLRDVGRLGRLVRPRPSAAI